MSASISLPKSSRSTARMTTSLIQAPVRDGVSSSYALMAPRASSNEERMTFAFLLVKLALSSRTSKLQRFDPSISRARYSYLFQRS